MYITNIRHLIDAFGKMHDELPSEVKELAAFLPEVIESTSFLLPNTLTSINVSCFKNGCKGTIISAVRPDNKEIHWFCPTCESEGLISDWQETEWDKRVKASLSS
jgi:hypothetical protein